MKKTIFIALTFVLSGMTAQAADLQFMSLDKIVGNQDYEMVLNNFDAIVNTTSDKFQQLVDLAHQGQSGSFSAVEGVYTGRCYDMVNRNLPRNSVLLITQFTTNEGPLFPAEKVVIEGGYSGAVDVADSKTKETLTADTIVLKSHYSGVVESPLSVVMSDGATTSHNMTYFKNQNYILGLTSANQDQEINVRGDGKITVKKGDVWAACYYFNKK